MKRLDGPVRKQMQSTIDKIVAGDPGTMAQTHPLIGPMKGWMATKGSRGHRVIHRPNADGGIHIGYVGLHEYDKAIQRLTSRTAGHYDTPEGHVTLYRGLHFGPMDDAERKHMHTDPVGYLQHEQPHHRSLGIHWTQDMDSAYHFAMGQDPHGNNDEDYSHYEDEDGSVHPGGMILEAHVPKHHIVEHGTKEWQDYADSDAIFHPDHPEAETTVRDSSSLHVHRIHTISHDQAKNAWAPPTVESHDVSLHKQATKTAGASQGALPWGRFQQALSTFPTHPDYHHQDRAAGRCVQAADAFVDHAGVGSRVTLMHATDGLHMDANAWPKTEGAAAVHTVARVPTERGDQAVDWTARQFDAGASVPHVEPWDDFASRWESHT